MRNRLWIVVLTALLIQACATGGAQQKPVETAIEPTYVPLQGVDAKARFRQALKLLADGEAEAARIELALYLQDRPSSDVVSDLIDQIDTPSSIYFPEEYKEVTLGDGVSLSSLSKQYLGSVYKFHALAKYNGIAEPRTLYPGQSIRIPLTASAREAFASAGEAVPIPEETSAEELALPDEPDEPVVAEEIDGADAAQDVAPEEPEEVDPAKVASLHREALNAYRGQNLDKAIELWDEVLELDPDHENARIYRSQAESLKKRLKNLN